MSKQNVMTVKELRERLEKFDDNLIIMIPNMDWTPLGDEFADVPARNVVQGVNEFDGYLFIDDYMEDDD